jgi:hypothetical protein
MTKIGLWNRWNRYCERGQMRQQLSTAYLGLIFSLIIVLGGIGIFWFLVFNFLWKFV